MIYKIDLRNDAYGTIDKEIYIETDLSKKLVEEYLPDFRNCLIEMKLTPEVSCARAFGPTTKIVEIETLNIYY